MIRQAAKSKTTTSFCKWIRILIWIYSLLVAALWFFIYQGGDRWWPATLILFGPRWMFSLPLLILVPLAAWFERRQLIILAFAAVILFIPFMGLCIPWKADSSQYPAIRVLTCNAGGHGTDTGKLRRLIERSDADIVALQECNTNMRASFPQGWRVIREADFIVASHYPMVLGAIYKTTAPSHQWPQICLLQCRIQTSIGRFSFSSIHLPSPHPALSSLLDRRTILNLSNLKNLNSEKDLRRKASKEIARFFQTESDPAIIAGDFNMPVESVFYRRFWSEYSNAFSTAGFGYGLTMQAMIRGFEYGIRIDHILMHGPLTAEKCWVAPDIGSDHLPVIADIRRLQQ
jgi:vancomycin resistance protein VanJ